ncbi:hypothetical protein GCM10010286_18630 [Streptomyces toxytricini]|nr:hypothetical protein GCM10010286_18630 [Streptomyces toxytricini]
MTAQRRGECFMGPTLGKYDNPGARDDCKRGARTPLFEESGPRSFNRAGDGYWFWFSPR